MNTQDAYEYGRQFARRTLANRASELAGMAYDAAIDRSLTPAESQAAATKAADAYAALPNAFTDALKGI